MKQNSHNYHRIIDCLGDDSGEVVLVISVEQMKRAGLVVGDELLIISMDNELIIRKK